MTQGRPLSLAIFNFVVDEVPQHWVTVVALTEEAVDPGVAGTEGLGGTCSGWKRIFMWKRGFSC